MKRIKCKDCKTILGKSAERCKSTRCKSCAAKYRNRIPENNPMFGKKGKKSGNYKHGKTLKKYYCIEGCGKQVNTQAVLYGSGLGRCNSCSNKLKSQGKNNSNYIDGRTFLTIRIRENFQYNEWRKAIFVRDNYTCVECNQVGGQLNADHIKAFSIIFQEFLEKYNNFSPIDDKEILLQLALRYDAFWNIENGRTLCIPCHKLTLNFAGKSKKKVQ